MGKTNISALSSSYRKIAAIIAPLILLICLMQCWLLTQRQADRVLTGSSGIWDLRGIDLSEESLLLVGETEYIPDALLTPEQYAQREDEALLTDRAFPQQYGTSRIRILVPENGWYTLTRTSIDYSTRLYVNGTLYTEVGSPGEKRGDTVPNIGCITVSVHAADGVIELVQQSANFVHRSGGYHGGWQVGDVALADRVTAANYAIVLELGSYFVLFFLHILLFLILPTYRPNLYFAAYCLTWFFRMGTTGSSIFTVLLPWLPWNIKFRMEYAAVSIAILLSALIIQDVFPDVIHRWAMWVTYASNAFFVFMCLTFDTVLMSWIAPFFLVLCLMTGGYLMIRFAMKLRKPTTDQVLLLVGIGLIVCTSVRDIVLYAQFVIDPSKLYIELTQVAVLACALLAATAFFLATMREVEKAKESEQQLALENAALSQVNQLKTELMGNLSHELRTPLTVMSGYAQLSAQQVVAGTADEKTLENLGVISREARRLAELTTGVLHMSMAQNDREVSGACSVADAVERAAKVCRPILDKNKNKLIVQIPEALPQAAVDSDLIQQVLMNLLSNSSRAMRGGEIQISAQRQTSDFIAIAVQDTAGGIAEDILPSVFQRGVSGNNGSGIGLSVCKELVESHGGTIVLDSVSGEGTIVTFTVPTSRD